MKTLTDLFKQKPYLAWYVGDKTKLSEKSMLEHVLNYGTWEDYEVAESVLGLQKIKLLFSELIRSKRVNLRSQTENYFTNYLKKYA
ncbi:MAG: hypothetical protein ABSE04_03475 [Candidatus Microgenomates bacterium]|jgi:hypothetical protein